MDAAHFETMVGHSHRRDIAVARRFVGNEDDAADVVRESYLRAWRALPTLRREAHPSTWTHTIIATTARTWRRKRNHHAALAGTRRVVVLKGVPGLGHQEIATLLGIRESAAKARRHRTRRRLRLLLAERPEGATQSDPLTGAA